MDKRINVQRKKLYEEIIDQINDLITKQNYSIGDKLPSLNELAEIFNVGKASLREALSVLTATGILEIRHGSGIYIRKLAAAPQYDALLQFDNEVEIEQMIYGMELRRAIEVEAAGLAAKRRTDQDLLEIEKAYFCIRDRILEGKDAGKFDFGFHSQIAIATHNPVLAQVMTKTSEVLKRQSFELSYKHLIVIPSRGELVIADHREILDAIKEGNVGEARRAMKKHIDNAEKKLLLLKSIINERKREVPVKQIDYLNYDNY